MPEEFHQLLEFTILASQLDPFDPMEKAIKESGDDYLTETEHLHKDWSLVHEYPLSKELLSLSRVWKASEREDYIIAAKGAPEAIIDLCHFEPGFPAISVKWLIKACGCWVWQGHFFNNRFCPVSSMTLFLNFLA
jgi:magnesium-transporting ATPase (P-type)